MPHFCADEAFAILMGLPALILALKLKFHAVRKGR